MIGSVRPDVLRAHDVVGTRDGNGNPAGGLFVAVLLLVARHVAIHYAALFVERRS